MLKQFCLYIGCFFCCLSTYATNYYINAAIGSNENSGTSKSQSWKSQEPLQQVKLQAGDSILFASGQQFKGNVSIINVFGTSTSPVVITSYLFNKNTSKPILDAGSFLNAIYIENSSFIAINNLELTATSPYLSASETKKTELRCGILVKVLRDDLFQNIAINNVLVHDVYYNVKGYARTANETASANGTQSYGWGIRFINESNTGKLSKLTVFNTEIYNVCHTGLKFTAPTNGIENVEIKNCYIHETGGPGLQLSGVANAHIHHNKINFSGSTADSRNWGRGSGMWTWGCSNILIEHNRFENANGPGDSAGVHIDFNCNDVVVQYNVSANNAGGFCEILGNNYNCAYRYNISINDGYRVKGVNGAFQEGKIFWLSGYQGNSKEKAGPYNSYFYNNTIYVAASIVPRIAVSTSAKGVYIANNIFYFEKKAAKVTGDQKKNEVDIGEVSNVVFKNNLFLDSSSWPKDLLIQDKSPILGNPKFQAAGGLAIENYKPSNLSLIRQKGIVIESIPNDNIGLKIGLHVKKDILNNPINGLPDLGAIQIN